MTAIIIPLFYSPLSIKVKILCGSNDVKIFVFSFSPQGKSLNLMTVHFFIFLSPYHCITITLKMSIPSVSIVEALSSDFISLAYTSSPKWFWTLLGASTGCIRAYKLYSSIAYCSKTALFDVVILRVGLLGVYGFNRSKWLLRAVLGHCVVVVGLLAFFFYLIFFFATLKRKLFL